MNSPERVYALLVEANPIPDPQDVSAVSSPALLDERRSVMLTQEHTETTQVKTKTRWPRVVAAFAATIIVVGAAIGIWAITGDSEPVAAGDAQIEATFTGDEAIYTGDREIIEGLAEMTFVNESDGVMWFAVLRFDTGSAELEAELAFAEEGDDFVATGDQPAIVDMNLTIPGDSTSVAIVLEPGTYILDFADEIETASDTHVWRAGVITVVAE